ncbi:stromelysin-3-like [Hemitrygon akajei]|uniref:stromelysin-3-like n=1 Tax=Hemitrygon akajei TaxID=2704970 RepID=UPI003BF9923F
MQAGGINFDVYHCQHSHHSPEGLLLCWTFVHFSSYVVSIARSIEATMVKSPTCGQVKIPEAASLGSVVGAVFPDACETDFDAVSMIRGELFFFKSKYVWRLRNRQLQPGYPALASQHWWDFPDHIDAGFEDTGGNFWIFQGSSYWIYDGEQRVLGPKLISDLGLPVAEVHAALMWGLEQNKIYLFKGNDYWQFIVNRNTVESVYPRSTSEWQGLPPSVDGAFQDEYGYAYFLRGRDYWKFDPVQVKIQEHHPRRIGQDFFGCSSSPT